MGRTDIQQSQAVQLEPAAHAIARSMARNAGGWGQLAEGGAQALGPALSLSRVA